MDVDFLRYQFEDGFNGVIVENNIKIGVRHIQLLYMVVASIVMGSLRGSVGVGVLAMTDLGRRNDSYIQIHNWDRQIQGTILSAFFFGYAVLFVPLSLYLHKFSGKLTMTAALLINGALCVSIPTIANKGGWVPVCNAYMIMGMTQACVCPAHQSLIEKWFPPNEKKIINPIVYGGILLGIILAVPVTQIIAEFRLGWELIYYSQGMLHLSFAIAWFLLTSDSPEQHQAMGDKEKEFLDEALTSVKKKQAQVPWRSIYSSKQFWCIVCAHCSTNAIFVFYLTDVPALTKYFTDYYKETSFVPFIAMWIVYVMSAPTIDYIYRTGFVTYLVKLTYYRKIVNGLGAGGVVIALTMLPHMLISSNLTSVVLIATMGLIGFQYSGFLENFKDISENYKGSVLLASTSVANVAGAFIPLITGLIIGDGMLNIRRWRSVAVSVSSLYLLGNIIYTGFSSSKRQPWDSNTTKFGYHNRFMHDAEVELEELRQTKFENKKFENDTAL